MTTADSKKISELLYNHKPDQWWNGKVATVTSQIGNMHNHSLDKGDQVIIRKKKSCQNDSGIIHNDSFLVETEEGGEFYSIPRTYLNLINH